MSLRGCCICCGGGGDRRGSRRIRMKNMTGIDETGWYKTLITIAMSKHPKPIRIVAIQHCHKFASLDADVVLISCYECVKDNISSGRWILQEI